MDQRRLDKTYLNMAEELANLSYAKKKKVGALIVQGTHIISEGYNGTLRGFDNVCEEIHQEELMVPPVKEFIEKRRKEGIGEDTLLEELSKKYPYEVRTLPQVLHAESNAITKLAKSTQSSQGATLYCTLNPCFDCALLIIQAGIKRVVYREEYKDMEEAMEILKEAGVEIVKK